MIRRLGAQKEVSRSFFLPFVRSAEFPRFGLLSGFRYDLRSLGSATRGMRNRRSVDSVRADLQVSFRNKFRFFLRVRVFTDRRISYTVYTAHSSTRLALTRSARSQSPPRLFFWFSDIIEMSRARRHSQHLPRLS